MVVEPAALVEELHMQRRHLGQRRRRNTHATRDVRNPRVPASPPSRSQPFVDPYEALGLGSGFGLGLGSGLGLGCGASTLPFVDLYEVLGLGSGFGLGLGLGLGLGVVRVGSGLGLGLVQG